MTEPSGVVASGWWTPRAGVARLRAHELRERIGWGVAVRWAFVGGGGLLLAAASAGVVPLAADHLAAGVVLLAVGNLGIVALAGRATPTEPAAKRLLWSQAVLDFAALAVLGQAFGAGESPLPILFVPHIVLGSLLLSARDSVLVALCAAAFATFPVAASVSGPYGFGVLFAYLACWYLVSQVANGLQRREAQLEADYDHLVAAAEAKTLATLRATHELKAPIAAIQSYLFNLRDGYAGPLPDSALHIVQRMSARCDLLTERIVAMIHLANLVALSRSEVKLAPVDLAALLAVEVADGSLRGQPREVVVLLDAPEPVVWVLGEATGLRTLFANLIGNAVAYSHPGGVVRVRLRDQAGLPLVEVVDQGIGIAPEHLLRVFDDHFRTAEAARHRPDGSGLGLAIVREVARLHSAKVELHSVVGEGTRVEVRFPARCEPPPSGTLHA